MEYDVSKGKVVYVDRSGSCEGIECLIEPNNEMENEFAMYEKYYLDYIDHDILPPMMDREIKQSKNIFNLVPNWQCGYCKYQGLSCNPNMSTNKIAEMKDDVLVIRKGCEEYQETLNNILKPKEYTDDKKGFADFVNDVNKGGK